MPTAEEVPVQEPPEPAAPQSPLREGAVAAVDAGEAASDPALVGNSSMDDDDNASTGSNASEDLLASQDEAEPSSPSPANILAALDGAAVGNDDGEGVCAGKMDDSGSENEAEEGPAIGELDAPLDPSEGRCWACLVDLRSSPGVTPKSSSEHDGHDRACLYATHEHPLLRMAVCSVCAERAECAEGEALDAANTVNLDNSKGGAANDPTACSWCGLAEDELGEHDGRDDFPSSDLMLCDGCPRGVCVRCAVLSLGGDKAAWEAVRKAREDAEGEWKCPACRPTEFLERLRGAYNGMVGSPRSSSPSSVNADTDATGGDDGAKDEEVEKLIRELDFAEYALDEAAQKLDYPALDRERERIHEELLAGGAGLEDAEGDAEAEMERYMRKWEAHHARFTDTIGRLQDELEGRESGVVAAYYACRKKDRGEDAEDDDRLRDYRIEANLELDRRDEREGFGRGQSRGASGYHPNPRVVMLEPEDLNAACLGEIEDVNTLEGAIEVMERNKKREPNAWSRGTTDLDIDMFRKKAVAFEKINLGEKLDLDKLEKQCTTEKDDAAATKKEGAMVVRRKGSGSRVVRVVRRAETVLSFKKRVSREATRARLSGESREYQPKLPAPPRAALPAPPREKKRAQLQRLSGSRLSAGSTSPSMRGLLIGNDVAQYEGSDVVLPVQGCASKISVCKPFADLLKQHQIDGIQFCWKNVCSNLLNFRKEGATDVHGAILAHNMGLGKSLQAVCLLHTLLTHPALVAPPVAGGGPGKRLVSRAILIAPVNTLANWETEFQKWLGIDSGRNLPAIRFYPWSIGDQRTVKKIVKEWCDFGGILCVSSDRYASTCKRFLDEPKSGKKKANNGKKSPVPTEEDAKKRAEEAKNDAFLREALFNPGPDIAVIDEVHEMFKSDTTNVFKVLKGLATRLRLGLTGSPLQNNLYEIYRMSNWVKPGSFGTESSFTRMFHDPIMAGMASDCTVTQAEKQEQASSTLHATVAQFAHRRDAKVLAKDLPFLQETIIQVRQSKPQAKLYSDFRKYQRESGNKSFFKQYHALRPVANHPAVLIYGDEKKSRPNTPTPSDDANNKGTTVPEGNQPHVAPEKYAWTCDKCQVAKFRTFEEAVEHEEKCDVNSRVRTKTNAEEDWWKAFAERAEKGGLDLKGIEHGGKIVLLLQILAHCDLIGDKVVVFSQSLATLSYIEEVLNHPDWMGFKFFMPDNVRKQKLGGWRKNQEYLRIDGSVDAKERGDLIDTFHADDSITESQRSKLFLISTKAGGLGINLVAANRVVLFDSHWNPAVDNQAIFRCYRYGQTKPTFCYRLLAEGSMEQKVYSRAATKMSLSNLVIDEKNPERNFTNAEMDLLRVEDTWVSCEACSKWRMMPPDMPEEEVQALPDQWYCKDNIYDRARSTCEAEERGAVWMAAYYERRAKRDADGEYLPPGASQSQGSQCVGASQGSLGGATATKFTENDHRYATLINKYTERDDVLQTLIARGETTKTASAGSVEGKFSWLSKWDFANKEEMEDDEQKEEEAQPEQIEDEGNAKEPAKAPAKPKSSPAKSPRKKANSPKKASPAKKPTSPKHSPTHKKSTQLELTPDGKLTKPKSPAKKSGQKTPSKGKKKSSKSSPADKESAPPEVKSAKQLRAKTPSKGDCSPTSDTNGADSNRKRRKSVLRSSKKKSKEKSRGSNGGRKRKSSGESQGEMTAKPKEESPPPEKKVKDDSPKAEADSKPSSAKKASEEEDVIDLCDSDTD